MGRSDARLKVQSDHYFSVHPIKTWTPNKAMILVALDVIVMLTSAVLSFLCFISIISGEEACTFFSKRVRANRRETWPTLGGFRLRGHDVHRLTNGGPWKGKLFILSHGERCKATIPVRRSQFLVQIWENNLQTSERDCCASSSLWTHLYVKWKTLHSKILCKDHLNAAN